MRLTVRPRRTRLPAQALGTSLVLILATSSATAAATSPRGDDIPPRPEIAAKAAIAVQPDTGQIFYSRNAGERRPIASATKLMTVLLALERLKLDEEVAAIRYDATPGESVAGLRAGESLTVADLVRAMLLPSANDAAATIAVAVAGSRRAFVAMMNRRARELGLRDTHYENPIGLDSRGNYSSAADLAALAIELRRHPFFRQTTDMPSLLMHSGLRKRVLQNRNTLLRADAEVDGIKTGHTAEAGYVLVGSATRKGVAVLSVVLGEPNMEARDRDSLALLDYGLAIYRPITAVTAQRPLAVAKIKDQGGDRVDLVASRSVKWFVSRDGELPTVLTNAPATVEGPLAAGVRVGNVEVRSGDRVVVRVPLVTSRAVPAASLFEQARARLISWPGAVLVTAVVIGSLLLVSRRRRPTPRTVEGASAQ